MKLSIVFLLATALLVSSCSYSKSDKSNYADRGPGGIAAPRAAATPAPQGQPMTAGKAQDQQGQAKAENIKLDAADKSQTPVVPTDRKIIRNGDLTLELSDPADAQRKIARIAESLGGFVVTSESKQSDNDGQRSRLSVTVIVRVPSSQFDAAMEKILGVSSGTRILLEKRTGQDVTEEFIDVEARIRTKKALEAQFMEIMKRAQKISDALEVQSQLAGVRGEIEQLEGRRRFLENQASLSTITINLQTPAPLMAGAPNGFWRSVREAFGDGLTGATEIILGVIRVVVVLLPVLLLIVLPAWLLWRFALRRFIKVWFRKPEPVIPSSQS